MKKGIEFTMELLDFMRAKMLEYQERTGNLYNLEATPAEGTTYRFAKEDIKDTKILFKQVLGRIFIIQTHLSYQLILQMILLKRLHYKMIYSANILVERFYTCI